MIDTIKAKVTYAESRKLEVKDEEGLECKIPGEVVQHRPQREALGEVEETENNPVCQPLDVIACAGGLEGLDGEVGREEPAEEVGDRGREGVDRVQDKEQGNTSKEGVRLGHLRALLELREGGVLGELRKRDRSVA